MDPDEVLTRMRELRHRIYARREGALQAEELGEPVDRTRLEELTEGDLMEFLESAMVLDAWLSAGGYLPERWTRAAGRRSERDT